MDKEIIPARFYDEKYISDVYMNKKISSENMTYEERDYYLRILENCKDICDTENKVGNVVKGDILKGIFRKDDNKVNFSLFITYYDAELSKRENRCVDGIIYLEKNKLLVDMHVDRLCISDEHKTYTVLDKFYLLNDKAVRESNYNYKGLTDDRVTVDIELGGLKK